MKRNMLFFALVFLLFGCNQLEERDTKPDISSASNTELRANQEDDFDLSSITPNQEEEYGEVMIVGEERINPYSVGNMQNAVQSLSAQLNLPQKTITSNAVYLRALPADSTEYNFLKEIPFEWFDYPLDRKIIKYGEIYKDPSLPQDAEFSWLYTTVYEDQRSYLELLSKVLPNLRVEVLDLCYIPEEMDSEGGTPEPIGYLSEAAILSAAKASTDSREYNDLLEIKAFQQMGLFSDEQNNASPLSLALFRRRRKPTGTIKVLDNYKNVYVPVKGVKVRVNLLVKWSSDHTNEMGRYSISKKFLFNPMYTVVFRNKNDFSIYKGINLLFIARDIKGFKSNRGYDITYEDSHLYWRDATINNAAHEYYALCRKNGFILPPRRLKIWQWSKIIGNSAPILRHVGAIGYEGTTFGKIVNVLLWMSGAYLPISIIRTALPDITINCENCKTNKFYNTVSHELAHASHFNRVGSNYWASYIWYIVKNGGYGDASKSGSGVCAVGEMWAYAIGNYAEQKQYELEHMPTNGNSWWFKPQVLSDLIKNDRYNTAVLTPREIAFALTPDVKSIEALKEKLARLYPLKKNKIYETFNKYGL